MDQWTFENDTFKNNTAFTKNTKYGGGAIAVERNATNNIFKETTFTLNSATTHGGAIKFMTNNKNNTFLKSTFDKNYAPYAGAIALGNTEELNIYETNFTNNKGTDADIIGGGAIYVLGNITKAYTTN